MIVSRTEIEVLAEIDKENIYEIGGKVELNNSEYKVHETSIENLRLHDISSLHPKMTESQMTNLENSISKVGQKVPVIIYRKKIVDGRHRFWAMKKLGFKTIMFVELPRGLTLKQVRDEVMATEIRRHQTATQKAIGVYKTYVVGEGLTQKEAALLHGVTQSDLSRIKRIYKELGSDSIDLLHQGKKVMIGLNKYASSITQIILYLNDLKKDPTPKDIKLDGYDGFLDSIVKVKANRDFEAFGKMKQILDDLYIHLNK